ncbi:PorP/SprF family type IX secretion system membrane protein [Deminuibacter soli]|uniref:Type IX secretion system membrane protein PorP/SprF n=1 Tax=Deminuibacter soli TaxID=2291815 RepID=A0A3E1NFN4_9BACT|nr:PorP/SprF family type IX secretion system membrane protein [Deminuibacter soli]RFM26783.1 type IX secretion system membrane protein PorP/SprF [Deminuibacter soli]
MRNNYKCYVLLLLVLCAGRLQAQVDPHFSQYYIYPAWLNPALTGTFDGAYRASAIYRNQWGNVGTPFSTIGASGEFTTEKSINGGVSVLKQTAGNGGYAYTTAYGNVAYTGIRFGRDGSQRVYLGLQFGLIQRHFDRNKLTFGSQWNPVTGFNGDNSNVILNRTSALAFDAGAGIMYFDATPGKKANIFGGVSFSHLPQSDDKFSASGTEKFPIRYTLHGGVRLALSDVFSITPNALYLKQRTATEKMIGAYGQYKVNEDLSMMLGANYRFKDALSPFIGFTHKGWALGASYDINNSDLNKMAGAANSFEISLTIIGKRAAKSQPVDFVCPRL